MARPLPACVIAGDHGFTIWVDGMSTIVSYVPQRSMLRRGLRAMKRLQLRASVLVQLRADFEDSNA